MICKACRLGLLAVMAIASDSQEANHWDWTRKIDRSGWGERHLTTPLHQGENAIDGDEYNSYQEGEDYSSYQVGDRRKEDAEASVYVPAAPNSQEVLLNELPENNHNGLFIVNSYKDLDAQEFQGQKPYYTEQEPPNYSENDSWQTNYDSQPSPQTNYGSQVASQNFDDALVNQLNQGPENVQEASPQFETALYEEIYQPNTAADTATNAVEAYARPTEDDDLLENLWEAPEAYDSGQASSESTEWDSLERVATAPEPPAPPPEVHLATRYTTNQPGVQLTGRIPVDELEGVHLAAKLPRPRLPPWVPRPAGPPRRPAGPPHRPAGPPHRPPGHPRRPQGLPPRQKSPGRRKDHRPQSKPSFLQRLTPDLMRSGWIRRQGAYGSGMVRILLHIATILVVAGILAYQPDSAVSLG